MTQCMPRPSCTLEPRQLLIDRPGKSLCSLPESVRLNSVPGVADEQPRSPDLTLGHCGGVRRSACPPVPLAFPAVSFPLARQSLPTGPGNPTEPQHIDHPSGQQVVHTISRGAPQEGHSAEFSQPVLFRFLCAAVCSPATLGDIPDQEFPGQLQFSHAIQSSRCGRVNLESPLQFGPLLC